MGYDARIMGPGIWQVQLRYSSATTVELRNIVTRQHSFPLIVVGGYPYRALLFSMDLQTQIRFGLWADLFDTFKQYALHARDPHADRIDLHSVYVTIFGSQKMIGVTHLIPTWAGVLRSVLVHEIGRAPYACSESFDYRTHGMSYAESIVGLGVRDGKDRMFRVSLHTPLVPECLELGIPSESSGFQVIMRRSLVEQATRR